MVLSHNESRTLAEAAHTTLRSELPDVGSPDVITWRDGPGRIHPLLTRQCSFCLLAGLNKCVLNKQRFSRGFLATQYTAQEVIENDHLPFTSLDWKAGSEGIGEEILWTRTCPCGCTPHPQGHLSLKRRAQGLSH